MKLLRTVPLMMAAAVFTFSSCQKDEIEPDKEPASAQSSTFEVRMTDAPGNFAALDVEIASVAVYNDEMGWVDLNNNTQYVSVLDLTNGAETSLTSDVEVEAGTYSEIRITFGENNRLTLNSGVDIGGLTTTSNTTVDLMMPGSNEVFIKIDEEVAANSSNEVLLDFSVAQSIEQQLTDYVLEPTITVIEDETTGVQGTVAASANSAVVITDGENEFSSYTDANGRFMIRGMSAGTYDMIITSYDELTGVPSVTQFDGVIITEGSIRNVGTIAL